MGGTFYGTNGVFGGPPGFSLRSFSPLTGIQTQIVQAGGQNNWWGLASNEGAGVLYVNDNVDQTLKSITPGGVITSIGLSSRVLVGMAYDDTNGILYGVDAFSLYTLNTSTGQSTLIGAHNIGQQLGLAYDEKDGVLYANAGRRKRTVETRILLAVDVGEFRLVE